MEKDKQWWCYVDRHTRIVMRHKHAVALSVVEFVIFLTLFTTRTRLGPYRVKLSRELVDEVYRGVRDPPLDPMQTVRATAMKMNRKLAHIRLRVVCVNRRHNSFYRLEEII
jgi:hypothetical protein